MLKRSGNLLHFPFSDSANSELVRFLLASTLINGFFIAALTLHFQGQPGWSNLMTAMFAIFALSGLLGGIHLVRTARRKVWIDLAHGVLTIGSSARGSQFAAANFTSIHSRIETIMTRGGRRIPRWVSVELHSTEGDLEIARFSNAKFSINHWSDHAQAQLLRKLVAEHWNLKDYGVLGKTLPQILADEQASMEHTLSATVLPAAADKWIRRGFKLGLLVLALPFIAAGVYALLSGQLTLEDIQRLSGGGIFIVLIWLAVDMIGNRAGIHKKTVQVSAWIAIACGVMTCTLLLAASPPDWKAVLAFAGTGVVSLTYWLHQRRSLKQI